MKYTTLLMDADETIFDFGKCEYNALKAAIEANGLTFNDEILETFSAINRRLWKKLETKCITSSQLRIQRFRELIEKCFEGFENTEVLAGSYIQELSKQAILIEGADKALAELSRSFDIYIITNGMKTVQRGRLSRTDITSYIRNIYISDELGISKPYAEFFDIVLADIREQDKSKILVVGDSLTSDMQGGRNAGLDTCLYDPKLKTEMPNELCDYRITELMQIFDLAEEKI